MHTFTDRAGREWSLDLDVPAVERIQTATPVRVGKLVGTDLAGLDALLEDPVLFVRVLYAMTEPQTTERGVSPESFGAGFGGDALEDAADAFLRALADFSPRQQRRTLLALCGKAKEVGAQATALMLEEIEALRVPTRAELDELKAANRPTSSTSATSAGPSSGSTPTAAG